MILSDEPGYYEDGKFGIRIENIVKIVPAATKHNFQGTGTAIYCYRLRAVDTVPGTYQVPTRYQVPGTGYRYSRYYGYFFPFVFPKILSVDTGTGIVQNFFKGI